MKKVEIALLILILLGYIFITFGVDGGRFILTMSFLSLGSLYMFTSALLLNDVRLRTFIKNPSRVIKEIGSKRLVFTTMLGYLLCQGVIGVLFGINEWEGRKQLLIIGLLSIIIAIMVTFISSKMTKSPINKNILVRAIVISVFTITFLYFNIFLHN